MKIEVKRGSKGNLLLLVRFSEASNFHREDLSWVPTLAEVRDIAEALERMQDKKKN